MGDRNYTDYTNRYTKYCNRVEKKAIESLGRELSFEEWNGIRNAGSLLKMESFYGKILKSKAPEDMTECLSKTSDFKERFEEYLTEFKIVTKKRLGYMLSPAQLEVMTSKGNCLDIMQLLDQNMKFNKDMLDKRLDEIDERNPSVTIERNLEPALD